MQNKIVRRNRNNRIEMSFNSRIQTGFKKGRIDNWILKMQNVEIQVTCNITSLLICLSKIRSRFKVHGVPSSCLLHFYYNKSTWFSTENSSLPKTHGKILLSPSKPSSLKLQRNWSTWFSSEGHKRMSPQRDKLCSTLARWQSVCWLFRAAEGS